MDHAITDKPVVTSWIWLEWVGPDTDIDTAERSGYLTGHRELVDRKLTMHGLVNTSQEKVFSQGVFQLSI